MTEKDFVVKWIEKIRVELKKFPADFIKNEECTMLTVPQKLFIFPPPLFNTYQIMPTTAAKLTTIITVIIALCIYMSFLFFISSTKTSESES